VKPNPVNALKVTFISLLALGAAACGTSSAASPHESSSKAPRVATIYAHQCGACHEPVAPGTHTRAELEAAFGRHRKRVTLSDAEWGQMVDFLAKR
jgi:hypothetical protein